MLGNAYTDIDILGILASYSVQINCNHHQEDEEGTGEVAGQSGGATEEEIDTAGRAD